MREMLCRCGKGAKVECGPGSLYQWCREKGHAATAAKCGKCCRCGRGTGWQCGPEGLQQGVARKVMPQRQRNAENGAVVERWRKENVAQGVCSRGTVGKACRNGRESREVLPLWKRNRMAMRSRRPAAGVPRERLCRNGSEMRKLLPLWKRAKVECGPWSLYQRCREKGNAATAAKCGKCCRCGSVTGWQCRPEGL